MPSDATEPIRSVEQFIARVKADHATWSDRLTFPWFRGQPVDKPLLPKVFRANHQEWDLFQYFRARAPAYGPVPPSANMDDWLFLMQHCGLPTRCLDWTEAALVALFFAVQTRDRPDFGPVVWMLNPIALNLLSIGQGVFPLGYFDQEKLFKHSFHTQRGHRLPVAMHSTYVHARLAAQKACFTVHGLDHRSVDEQMVATPFVAQGYLRKYAIAAADAHTVNDDLRLLGVTHSGMFPDFDGLAVELAARF